MREYSLIVENRPVLVDRIQVNVTPSFKQIYDFKVEMENKIIVKQWILKEEYENYKDLIIKNKKLKKLKHKTFRTKGAFHYLINIPSDIPYVSDIKVNALPPFSVSFKINFIRLLRQKIFEKWELNGCYDKQIFLDDNNYICPKTWAKWDYNLISGLINELNDICLKIADMSLYYILPYHNIEYEKVIVKQIETNIDFNVGSNNSLFAINNILNIFKTKEGNDFRKKVGEIAFKNRIPFEETSTDPTTVVKNESVSFQFQICRGLFFKVYRKTSDHIRCELLFEKEYLKNKFRKYDIEDTLKESSSTDIKRIVKPVLEFSKGFYKNLNFEEFLSDKLSNPTDLFVMDYIEPVFEVLVDFNSALWDLICCIKNNHPIIDIKTKKFIQKNRKIARWFFRSYMGDLGYVYVFRGCKKDVNKGPVKEFSEKEILVGDKRPLFAFEKKRFEKKPIEVWKRPIPYDKIDFPSLRKMGK